MQYTYRSQICFKLIQRSAILLVFSIQAMAQPLCTSLFSSKNGPTEQNTVQQAEVSKNLSQLVRSNSNQYWAWVKNNATQYISTKPLSYQGWVVGDPHNKNFGILRYNGKVRWSLVDYDDPGKGPYILDLAKFIVATKAVASDVKTKHLWRAYLQGLKNENMSAPLLVREVLSLTSAQLRDIEVDKAMKYSQGDRLINDGERSTAIENEKLKLDILKAFQNLLPDLKILDVGGREKDRGGSQEAMRFLALVKGKDGRNTLFELKENLGSALENYQDQATDFSQALTFYLQGLSAVQKDRSYQSVNIKVNNATRNFLFRPKQLYFFDNANKADKSAQLEEFRELSIYNAWYLGRIHGQQKNSAAYAKLLVADNEGALFEGIKDLVQDYLVQLDQHL